MALDPKAAAAIALHRFGLGPRIGSIAAIASDPRGALLSELDSPPGGRINDPGLLSGGESARAAFKFRQEQRAIRLAERSARDASSAKTDTAGATSEMKPPEQSAAPTAIRPPGPGVPQRLYLEEAKARIHAALDAKPGFVERLVWFWSHHFCVSADKGIVRPICGAYEREAIRPHVLGRFTDMLLAVEGHPAMLFYLDNLGSMGADSIAGINRARETLELHTLGVRSGYTQDDVISFANVLTGWTLLPAGDNPEHGGEFTF